MEFKFNVSEIFPHPIVEVNQSLIPPGFCGDRRGLSYVVTKVADVVNTMGDASAAAQGLSNPITTADRLRKADQTVYLLVDRNAKGGKGVVTGLLKTGKKSLYIFDRDGQHYHVAPPCILDFYIHESRQRQGLGKQLFEHMLQKEKVEPSKLAIDRPSEKLLSFMNKHYGLQNAMRQMNNYVVFDGFFPEMENKDFNRDGNIPSFTKESANGLQSFTSYGRYGAPRPQCSMGEIIHNQSPLQTNDDIRNPIEEAVNKSPKLERPRSLTIQRSDELENLENQIISDLESEVHFDDIPKDVGNIEIEPIAAKNVAILESSAPEMQTLSSDSTDTSRKSPNSLTAQGFFDLKFYHSRLW